MLKFAVDENFNMQIVNGVLRRQPGIDLKTVRSAGLEGADDRTILEWAALEKRILLTHDVNTLTYYAYERVEKGITMPGIFEVPLWIPIGTAIENILLIANCSLEGEWEGQVNYFPLR